MMNIQFISVGVFKDILDALHALLTEGTFVVNEKGISFKATDPTMVTLVELFYSKDNFSVYEVEGEVYLTLNIDLLRQSLKKAKTTDKVSFVVEKDNINRLNVIIEGKHIKKFVLPILESEIKEIPELNLEFKGKAEILSNLFADTVEDAASISDVLTIKFTPDELVMEAESELTSLSARFTKSVEGVVDIQAEGEVSAKYSVDYLKKIIKAKKIAPTVIISINQDAPAKFEFKDGEDVWMYYVLAPRVEE
ncbi:MAG: proliferating cell nuclear antigen (pcna) [Candidatus Nanohaloarchaeota archaeon]|nr:proliferating cell nuclear antigen (pcna) [Candidatus Nanohaloarchaeota archaeon]